VLFLAGLATSNKIILAVVAAVFIVLALSASFLAPRRWPNFPGRQGMSVFVLGALAMFVAMMLAVIFLAKESDEAEAHVAEGGGAAQQTIEVTETEFKIQLPAAGELSEGTYVFKVHNAGKVEHDLVIEGGENSGEERTKTIPPGGDAELTASLGAGQYTLYCSIPGHRQLGMVAKLSVG
jgi:uncharacterized cupredoxin-like copper-binding protein